MDGFVYLYLREGQSDGRAVSSSLFIRLQGQLDVARPLRLLLGIDLWGQRLKKVSKMKEEKKGYLNYLKGRGSIHNN